MRAALALLVAAASLATLAPSAAGQVGQAETRVTLESGPSDVPIRPAHGMLAVPLVVEYHALPVPTLAPTLIELVVVEAPPWAVVSVTPSVVFLDPPAATEGPTGARSTTATLYVSVGSDAPAFTPATVGIQAVARENGVHKASTGSVTTLVTADYFGALRGEALGDARYVRDEASALVRVQNLGNAASKVSFELVSAPDGAEVRLPAPVTLESRQQGGRDTRATLPVRVLGGTPGEVVLVATPRYALDAEIVGPPTEVRFDVLAADDPSIFEVQGGVGGAGGLAVPVWTGILGALAGAGLYVARPARRPGRRHGIGKP